MLNQAEGDGSALVCVARWVSEGGGAAASASRGWSRVSRYWGRRSRRRKLEFGFPGIVCFPPGEK